MSDAFILVCNRSNYQPTCSPLYIFPYFASVDESLHLNTVNVCVCGCVPTKYMQTHTYNHAHIHLYFFMYYVQSHVYCESVANEEKNFRNSTCNQKLLYESNILHVTFTKK